MRKRVVLYELMLDEYFKVTNDYNQEQTFISAFDRIKITFDYVHTHGCDDYFKSYLNSDSYFTPMLNQCDNSDRFITGMEGLLSSIGEFFKKIWQKFKLWIQSVFNKIGQFFSKSNEEDPEELLKEYADIEQVARSNDWVPFMRTVRMMISGYKLNDKEKQELKDQKEAQSLLSAITSEVKLDDIPDPSSCVDSMKDIEDKYNSFQYTLVKCLRQVDKAKDLTKVSSLDMQEINKIAFNIQSIKSLMKTRKIADVDTNSIRDYCECAINIDEFLKDSLKNALNNVVTDGEAILKSASSRYESGANVRPFQQLTSALGKFKLATQGMLVYTSWLRDKCIVAAKRMISIFRIFERFRKRGWADAFYVVGRIVRAVTKFAIK